MKLAVDATDKMEMGSLKVKEKRGGSCGFWRRSEGFFIDL
jgi:hypothetical protein